ncbi:hypothetical protein LPJ59_004192 [Coemansia sp. RSA 2399]|nr:hypothetical protein LPJ59_004192 [Coemansia sp. RSA 2399]
MTFNSNVLTFVAIVIGTCLSILAQANSEPIVLGYYPSWKRVKMQGIDFSKYTHVNIAFSIPRSDGTFSFEDEWALPQILKQLREGGTKVLMSVGGWTGSNLFSSILKNSDTREKMISSMTDYVKTNDLDGIDIDWEYPGRLGNTCNEYDAANDAPNFLVFLKDLRARFDSTFDSKRKKLITLAVRVQPFDISSGPMDNVSEFAKYVDYANIMAYDIDGPWNSETGPNAPFNYKEGNGTPLSFVSSIDAWTKAKWPASQLVAGLGFYGRSSTAKQDMTRDATNQFQPQEHNVPLGDSEDAPWYDSCARSTSASGTWQWKNLRQQGVLTSPDKAAGPWVRQWDPATQTPWLFNPTTNTFLSYDDPQSIKIKSDHAASKGLAGVMIWSANMDYNGELVDAARSFGKGASSPSNGTHTTSSSLSSSQSLPFPSSLSLPLPTVSSSATPSATPSPSSQSNSRPSASSSQLDNSPPNSTNDVPVPDSPCRMDAKFKCVDPSGRNAAYLVCSGGKWIPRSCAAGTACYTLGESIVCSWPALRGMLQGLNSLIHHD